MPRHRRSVGIFQPDGFAQNLPGFPRIPRCNGWKSLYRSQSWRARRQPFFDFCFFIQKTLPRVNAWIGPVIAGMPENESLTIWESGLRFSIEHLGVQRVESLPK